MGAETDLTVLLTRMDADLRPGSYVVSTVQDPTTIGDIEVLATVSEQEGLSLVTTREDADRAELSYNFVAGWITLQVQSALNAVGLTAAVSTTLAEAGISCNVLAGYHHDHVLVPLDRAQDALTVLHTLASDTCPDQ